MELWSMPAEKGSKTMDPGLCRAIQRLPGLTVPALRNKYRNVFGEEPPSKHKQFLVRRIAWQLQAQAEGDLSERARRRAAEIADETDLRIGPGAEFLSNPAPAVAPATFGPSHAQRDWRLPAPGTRLQRRFQGRDLVVKVLEQGFEHDSKRYRSLSAIAREVTGTRWNGLLFFGLTGRRNE